MGIPEPKVAINDACSTIYNNTLYSYSPTAFQSLRIRKGAQWEVLDSGVSLTGAQCVHATPQDDKTPEALYIVGGTSTNQTSNTGLQRYIFAESRWETLTPPMLVTQNRLYHSAVYLNSSANILVFAGTQDGTMQPSTQTFTISTAAGNAVDSYVSIAPPTISPLLMQWSSDAAVVMGGSDTNTVVMIFTVASSWTASNISLADPLKNRSVVQAVITDGDDGSKSLYTFDMSVAPNQVNRTVLLGAGGEPVLGASAISNKKVKGREEEKATIKSLTLSDWPSYNSTFAPMSTRTTYSLAQDSNGMVVITGGNPNDSICLFQATENTWLNTTSEFTLPTKTQIITSTLSSVPIVAASSTNSIPAQSSISAQSSASAADTGSKTMSKSDSMKVLGAVLGSVIGVALFLMLILLFLRWQRKTREHAEVGHQRRASGLSDEKDGIQIRSPNYGSSFLDLDTTSDFKGHKAGKESHGSFSSVAILMGKVGGNGHKRGGLGRNNGSNASSASSMFNKQYKNAISNPIPHVNGLGPMNGGLPVALVKEVSFESDATSQHAQAGPATRTRASNNGRRGSTRRSSGWNKYWSGGSGAMNILGLGSKRNTCSTGSERSTDSQYSTDQKIPSKGPRVSALTLPPTHSSGGNFGLSRVMTGSPTISHNSEFPFAEGMSGQIGHSRPGSASSDDSFDARRRTDPFSSGVPESVHEFGAAITSWDTPLPAASRTDSSHYSSSNYDRTTMGTSFHYGGNGSSTAPSVPSFPAPPSSLPPGDEAKGRTASDMSWLNLGANSSREPGPLRI